jgi:SAM-dependent methyltransferase
MKSHPYLDIDKEIVSIVKPLIDNSDEYHRTHAARLARTFQMVKDTIQEYGGTCRILELGTTGLFPVALKSLFPGVTIDVTNYDNAWTLVESFVKDPVSQVVCELAGESVTVAAFAVDLEYDMIPAEDETYDIVLCCEVLEHMEIDPMHMLSEVNRVLKTNGKIIVTTPNVVSSRGIAKMLQGTEPYFYMQYHKSREYHRHNYEYSCTSLLHVLRSAGFDANVWTEDLFEDGLTYEVNRLRKAGFIIENVGDNLLAIGAKVSEVVDRYPSGLYV